MHTRSLLGTDADLKHSRPRLLRYRADVPSQQRQRNRAQENMYTSAAFRELHQDRGERLISLGRLLITCKRWEDNYPVS